MKVIIGLGNPGSEYVDTRHNLGFKVVEKLCEQYKVFLKPSLQAKGLFAQVQIEATEVMFFLPMTYMNNSGLAVKRIVDLNEIGSSDILVVCDDFNLDLGRIRMRAKGSDGGHNGLSSIIFQLNLDTFPRLRLGIGAPPGKKKAADFVLEEFTKKEKEEIEFLVGDGADCCREWIRNGIGKAMELYNKKVSLE